jgi:catechol 2,3-dioxygenase-like lactoylglutathione lyase family enzyme
MSTYDHVAFQVGNLDQAIDFYVGKLGFALDFRSVNPQEHEAYAFLYLADLRLELIQDLARGGFTRPYPEPPYCPHLAIHTDDMAQAVLRLKEAGVPILRGPLEVEGEDTWLYFCDPDNNVLEYVQWYARK